MTQLNELIDWLHDEATGQTDEGMRKINATIDALNVAIVQGDAELVAKMETAVVIALDDDDEDEE